MTVTLPWPPRILSPNSRAHYMAVSKAKKAYREECAWQARLAGVRMGPLARPTVALTFYPPDRRHRDWDNMLASIKAGLDGLADAMGCDDSRWRLSIEVAEEIGGMVKVEVTA